METTRTPVCLAKCNRRLPQMKHPPSPALASQSPPYPQRPSPTSRIRDPVWGDGVAGVRVTSLAHLEGQDRLWVGRRCPGRAGVEGWMDGFPRAEGKAGRGSAPLCTPRRRLPPITPAVWRAMPCNPEGLGGKAWTGALQVETREVGGVAGLGACMRHVLMTSGGRL